MSTNYDLSKIGFVQFIQIRRCGSHQFRFLMEELENTYCPYPLHFFDLYQSLPLEKWEGKMLDQLIVWTVALLDKALQKWGVAIDHYALKKHLVLDNLANEAIPVAIYVTLCKLATAMMGKSFFVDKGLDNVHLWRHLGAEVKFIQVTRDPRAQLASINNAIIHNFSTKENLPLLVNAIKTAEEIPKERKLTVRYEDMITDYPGVRNEIAQYLGVACREAASAELAEEKEEFAKKSTLWSNNAQKLSLAFNEKWKIQLSAIEVQLIQKELASYFKKYHYEFCDPETAKGGGYPVAHASRLKAEVFENEARKDTIMWLLRKERAFFLNSVANYTAT